VGSVKLFIAARVTFRPFQGYCFWYNRKRVCDLLLIRHSNFGLVLHHFRDIAVFCAHDPIPIPPVFWVCSRWTRLPTLGSIWAGL